MRPNWRTRGDRRCPGGQDGKAMRRAPAGGRARRTEGRKMRAAERTLRSEQGAVFVQVGISIFVLMAFNVFVLDYGMMWVAPSPGAERRGCRRAWRAPSRAATTTSTIRRVGRGRRAAARSRSPRANLVWQQAGTPVVTFDCPPWRHGQVHSRRRASRRRTTAAPHCRSLFGPILGITSQGVTCDGDGDCRATETRRTACGRLRLPG